MSMITLLARQISGQQVRLNGILGLFKILIRIIRRGYLMLSL